VPTVPRRRYSGVWVRGVLLIIGGVLEVGGRFVGRAPKRTRPIAWCLERRVSSSPRIRARPGGPVAAICATMATWFAHASAVAPKVATSDAQGWLIFLAC
jgi:hypothetical protein